MKIHSISIEGLNNRPKPAKLEFNSDLSILTGHNGSGKTTILKLVWYILSGNLKLAFNEIVFEAATLETSEYTCILRRSDSSARLLAADGSEVNLPDAEGYGKFMGDLLGDYNPVNRISKHLASIGQSIYLPTFRRIEGGYALNEESSPLSMFSSRRQSITEALEAASDRLTSEKHHFVCSISATDVIKMLTFHHAKLLQKVDDSVFREFLEIARKIDDYEPDDIQKDSTNANRVLKEVQKIVDNVFDERTQIMQSFEALGKLLPTMLNKPGLALGSGIKFGDSTNTLDADRLSGGEKQLLSFLAYNAMNSNALIIIDEPELSLHIDWQRTLFTTLLKQNPTNQFIVATHSPSIYTKFADRELQISYQA